MSSKIIESILTNLALVLLLASLSLHVFGVYLLLMMQNRRTVQDIIIMNFSITEIVISCFDLTENVMSRWYDKLNKNLNIVTIASISMCLIPNFLILIVLTLNRFLEVYFNIKYDLYFDKKKAIFALLICWSVGLITASIAVPFRIFNHNVGYAIFIYVLPFIEGTVLVVAIWVYMYIYKKIRIKDKDLVQPPPRIQSVTRPPPPPPPAIKRKKFFLPFLIILSFFLFVVIPDITNLLLFYVYKSGVQWHAQVLYIFYTCGYICDALLYIFLQKHLREKCKRFLAVSVCCCRHVAFDVKKTEKNSMKEHVKNLGHRNQSYIMNDELRVECGGRERNAVSVSTDISDTPSQ